MCWHGHIFPVKTWKIVEKLAVELQQKSYFESSIFASFLWQIFSMHSLGYFLTDCIVINQLGKSNNFGTFGQIIKRDLYGLELYVYIIIV